MKRISKAMVERGGWCYCCVCRQLGPRVKAHWQHEGREYCDTHKPAPRSAEHQSEADHQLERRYGI
jgi:predicted GIY-YIG superfamily endonuclease